MVRSIDINLNAQWSGGGDGVAEGGGSTGASRSEWYRKSRGIDPVDHEIICLSAGGGAGDGGSEWNVPGADACI